MTVFHELKKVGIRLYGATKSGSKWIALTLPCTTRQTKYAENSPWETLQWDKEINGMGACSSVEGFAFLMYILIAKPVVEFLRYICSYTCFLIVRQNQMRPILSRKVLLHTLPITLSASPRLSWPRCYPGLRVVQISIPIEYLLLYLFIVIHDDKTQFLI